MYLLDLADACRASGLRVVEVPNWRTLGRPASTGGFDPQGVLCHHTGSKDTNPESITDDRAYAEWLAKIGRSDLPAPLCQISLDRTGTVYVCAAGRGNHAGTAKATGGMPSGDGNALYLGIEAHNTGSEGWAHKGTDAAGNTITQGEAYARLCAALCRHYDWPAAHVRAHRETSVTGKWDPGRLDMTQHRAAVARLITNPKIGNEGLDMDAKELRKIIDQALDDKVPGIVDKQVDKALRKQVDDSRIDDPERGEDDSRTWSLGRLLWSSRRLLVTIDRKVDALAAKGDA